MRYLEHFISSIDYDKLIKMQAKKTAPYSKAIDIKKNPKNIKVSSFQKIKRLGKRK